MRSELVDRSLVISTKNFPNLTTKTFKAKIRGHIFQGFVVRRGGKFFAYENLCQHLPITLDLKDGEFFTHDKKYLQCHMHGAMYEMDTGLCVGGPCEGAKLIALQLVEEENYVVVKIPEDFGNPKTTVKK